MIKIAYVNYIRDIEKMFGVYKKVLSQKKAVNNSGIADFNFFIFTENVSNNVMLDAKKNGIFIIKLKQYSNYIERHYSITKKINEEISDRGVGIVILRHLVFSPFWTRNFSNKNFILISEHHTKEIPEFLVTKNFKAFLPEFISYRSAFKHIDGLIAVTDEIKEYEIKRGFKGKNAIAIGNGIDVENINLTGFRLFSGKELNIIFVASAMSPWHGLDRVLRAMEVYKDLLRINLHIVGEISESYIKKYVSSFDNIELHGVLYDDKLDLIFKDMNVAMTTLALHRKKMEEACSLKTREYTARGIPFVSAYRDTDFKEEQTFIKNFKSEDSPINIKDVVMFCEKIACNYSAGELSGYMRDYAFHNLDWKVKMKKYAEFAKGMVVA